MATFLTWQLVHTFTLIFINLFTAATYPQRQQPPKLVPTVKITSSQQPVNKGLRNSEYKTQIYYSKKVTKIDPYYMPLVSVSIKLLKHFDLLTINVVTLKQVSYYITTS